MGRYVLDPRQLHGPSPSRHVDAWEDPQAGAAHGWGNLAETATGVPSPLSLLPPNVIRASGIDQRGGTSDGR